MQFLEINRTIKRSNRIFQSLGHTPIPNHSVHLSKVKSLLLLRTVKAEDFRNLMFGEKICTLTHTDSIIMKAGK